MLTWLKRGSRGGDRGSGPPPPLWDLSEVGSCVEAWWVGEGSNSCFYLIIINFFWLASLDSILYKHISTCIHTSKSNVQHGTVTLSLYFPYPNHEKIPFSHPLVAFIKRHFHIYLVSKYTILHQVNQKFSGGGSPNPLLDTFTISKLPCPLCVCEERGLQLYNRPCPIGNKLVWK